MSNYSDSEHELSWMEHADEYINGLPQEQDKYDSKNDISQEHHVDQHTDNQTDDITKKNYINEDNSIVLQDQNKKSIVHKKPISDQHIRDQMDAIRYRNIKVQDELKQITKEIDYRKSMRASIAKEIHELDKKNGLSDVQKSKLKRLHEQDEMYKQEIERKQYNADLIKQAYASDNKHNIELAKWHELKQIRKNKISHHFEYGVLVSKFIVIVTLLVVSFINTNIDFIAKEPQKFLGESIMVGATSAIAVAVIGINRSTSRDTIFNAMLLAFLVFFIFHILMEFSGMNGLMQIDTSTLSDQQKAERYKIEDNINITTKTVGSVFAIVGVAMLYMASQVWDLKNFKSSKYKYLLELVSFGLLSAAPAYFIDINRGNKSSDAKSSFFKMLILYSGGYMALQTGGFFSEIFGEMPNTIVSSN